MNVNFQSSVGQGKSLFFGKSNDGKKTLLRPIVITPPFWQVTITAPYQLEAPAPYNPNGFARALTQATFSYGPNPVYHRNPGCGSCVQMSLDLNINKFVFTSGGKTYHKDFTTNLTADGWTDISDNSIVNLTASGGTVSILPPS